MSNRRKLRTISGGRLTRPRPAWAGKVRDTSATYVGRASGGDSARAERLRLGAPARRY